MTNKDLLDFFEKSDGFRWIQSEIGKEKEERIKDYFNFQIESETDMVVAAELRGFVRGLEWILELKERMEGDLQSKTK